MAVVSNGTTIEVTFDSLLGFKGASDVGNYAISAGQGAVPVGVQGVELVYTEALAGVGTIEPGVDTSNPSVSRRFTPDADILLFDVGDYITLGSAWNNFQFAQVTAIDMGTLVLDRDLFLADPENDDIPFSQVKGLEGVTLTVNKLTNDKSYTLAASLCEILGTATEVLESFTAVSPKPTVVAVEQLDEGQVIVTFSDTMRQDAALIGPSEYEITGPTNVLVKTVRTLSPTRVMITTVGLGAGDYQLTVNASGTPHDIAGNPIDPVFNQAIFSGSPALASRSVFTDRGPITKPPQTLLSGATATITNATTLTLPTAVVTPSMVGLYITLTGSARNDGTFRITTRVSPTVIRVAASFSLPDVANGTIGWVIFDPRDGIIADDPTDVVVRVNSVPVVPEAVIGLLGQIVLSTVPSATDTVDVDYGWVSNPVVDFRRLNSKEFRLNNWNRDDNRPTDPSQHKYRYNNTLIQPETFVALDIRAEVPQPQERDLKYRAYERAYTAVLNDPNLLLLNSPNHRIAFPPLTRAVQSTFVNYQAATLPEADPTMPWERHGSGSASVALNELTVVDNTTGPFPGGNPLFWTRPIDLTFPHVFATAWRVRIPSVPVADGVFTGVCSGYADAEKAVVVGFLDDGGVKKVGILKAGSGNDPSLLAAWGGGFDGLGNATGLPVDLDWSILRSYRIFRDRNGVIRFYIDGSIAESLRVVPGDLPFLEELNDPFDSLQGAFFGSLSREAENTSVWSFVRYTAIPINPMQSAPSVFVSYEGTTPPEAASQPWTPVGFHGTETIISSDFLLLDSTSATDLPSETAAGLISGDFKGFSRIEPLLAVASDTVLDLAVTLRTFTHGVTPNAVMAAIDDGNRLIQLSFFTDQAAPKFSYGGRALPDEFAPYLWTTIGGATASMVGQYLKIVDASNSDGLVYFLDDLEPPASANRVVAFGSDYMLEFRVQVQSYTPDIVGYAGVMSQVYDSQRTVGLMFEEILSVRYVTFHSDGTPIVGARFAFNWFDNQFHTYRAAKSTTGNLVSLFIDGIFIGSTAYSDFTVPAASFIGVVSFGSSTPLSVQSQSTALWAYSNYWRVNYGFRKYAGLWKGYDPNALTGYHLPTKSVGRQAAVNGNVLSDPGANFVSAGVTSGDQLVIDSGANKGVYTVAPLNPLSATTVSIVGIFPVQPSIVDYRIVKETDWTTPHKYRILKDPSGGVSVSLDSDPPMILVGYNNLDLPSGVVGVARTIAGGLPSITFGAFDPTNLSQTSWDFVRFGATRTQPELGIVPHHQVLNQRNVMASFEHHRTMIPHTHTDFWSESEGIPPQTEPDLLRNPALVAYTLLNDRTPLVPSTQTYEVRSPTPVLTPIHGLNQPADVLGDQGFVLNDASQEVRIIVPDDVLYNSLQVIERSTGDPDLIAPFDDECQPSFGTIHFDHTSCLTYDGTTLPEDDTTAVTPWTRASDNPANQFASVFGGILTYGTDGVGTRTTYRNNTPLPDQIGLQTEVKFRLRVLQDASGGLGDSQVRVGFSSPGVTVGLAFITSPLGERYVMAVDLNNGLPVGGIPFDFYDNAFHDYRLVRDPGSASIQIFIDG